MVAASKILADAMELSEIEREDLAAQLLDSIELPPEISIEDKGEILRRAEEARRGVPGIPWSDVKVRRLHGLSSAPEASSDDP